MLKARFSGCVMTRTHAQVTSAESSSATSAMPTAMRLPKVTASVAAAACARPAATSCSVIAAVSFLRLANALSAPVMNMAADDRPPLFMSSASAADFCSVLSATSTAS
jgi:hypothetical protein